MAKNDQIYESLLTSTISNLDKINELEKQLSDAQAALEKKDSELLSAKKEIKKLLGKLSPNQAASN